MVTSLWTSCLCVFCLCCETTMLRVSKKDLLSLSSFPHPYPLVLAVNKSPRFLYSYARSTISPEKIDGSVNRLFCYLHVVLLPCFRIMFHSFWRKTCSKQYRDWEKNMKGVILSKGKNSKLESKLYISF